jgi:hypothetical protein
MRKVYQLLVTSALLFLPWLLCIALDDSMVYHGADHLVAFYNVFGSHQGDWRTIVGEQIATMNASGLLDRLDRIYYTTSGNEGSTFRPPSSKFTLLKDFGLEGNEDLTLSLLYKYCHRHSKAKVLYFHDKGSFHNSSVNVKFRRILDCFVLNPNCISVLNDHDTCGFRFSPIPWPHYTGNYWWATCHYISTKLIDPLTPRYNETFQEQTKQFEAFQPECSGVGRFFSEAWIGSAINYSPSDCLPSSINSWYIFGGNSVPESLLSHCPNQNPSNSHLFGAECSTPHMYLYPKLYSKGYHDHKALFVCKNDRVQSIVDRSLVWYGQAPQVFLDFTTRLNLPAQFQENDIAQVAYSDRFYVFREGCLQPLKTMEEWIRGNLTKFDDLWILQEKEVDEWPCPAPS